MYFDTDRDCYIGNLPWNFTESQLHELAAQHGDVVRVRIITDRETGQSRGFGFVRYASADDAAIALRYLDRAVLNGRVLLAKKVEPRRTAAGE